MVSPSPREFFNPSLNKNGGHDSEQREAARSKRTTKVNIIKLLLFSLFYFLLWPKTFDLRVSTDVDLHIDIIPLIIVDEICPDPKGTSQEMKIKFL